MPRGAGAETTLGALALSLALIAPAQAQIGEMKTFRDWVAACDNTRNCAAVSLPDDADDDVAYLRLDRPAGPDGAPTIALKLRRDKLPRTFEIELSLDNTPFPAAGRRFALTSNDGETAEVALAPAEADALVAGARKATALTLRRDGRSQKISLAGSVAAMLWIDERQGRLNTPSALIRKGTSGSPPPAPRLPRIDMKPAAGKPLTKEQSAALVKAMRAELNRREPDSCEEMSDGSDGAFPLDDSTRLIVVACSRGAYNVASQFWLVPGRDVAKAKPAEFEGSGGRSANELVNADYDPKTGRVMFFAKGRGIGDCGSSGSYGWTGTRFAVVELSSMSECRRIPGDDWITLFRSAEK